MRTAILIVILIGIAQSSLHLRQKQTHILKGQKLAVIQKQVQYVDDDVQLNGRTRNLLRRAIRNQQEEAVIQIDEEQTLNAEQMEELDRKEQEKYDRLKKQRLEEQHLNDEDSYMSDQENERKANNLYLTHDSNYNPLLIRFLYCKLKYQQMYFTKV